jgi:beta-phosphoglucomutase-like phosphatase (HAD superfamily)
MGLNAADCIAFEDSENGLLSATTAGLKTIVTTNEYTREHNFNGAMLVLDQLGEAEQAFTVQAGDAGGATYVDISLINRLFNNGI